MGHKPWQLPQQTPHTPRQQQAALPAPAHFLLLLQAGNPWGSKDPPACLGHPSHCGGTGSTQSEHGQGRSRVHPWKGVCCGAGQATMAVGGRGVPSSPSARGCPAEARGCSIPALWARPGRGGQRARISGARGRGLAELWGPGPGSRRGSNRGGGAGSTSPLSLPSSLPSGPLLLPLPAEEQPAPSRPVPGLGGLSSAPPGAAAASPCGCPEWAAAAAPPAPLRHGPALRQRAPGWDPLRLRRCGHGCGTPSRGCDPHSGRCTVGSGCPPGDGTGGDAAGAGRLGGDGMLPRG